MCLVRTPQRPSSPEIIGISVYLPSSPEIIGISVYLPSTPEIIGISVYLTIDRYIGRYYIDHKQGWGVGVGAECFWLLRAEAA